MNQKKTGIGKTIIILIIAFFALGNGGAKMLGIEHLMPWYEEDRTDRRTVIGIANEESNHCQANQENNDGSDDVYPSFKKEEVFETTPREIGISETITRPVITEPVEEKKDYTYAHGHYYQYLEGNERLVYDELIGALEEYAHETEITPITTTEYWNVYSALYSDHPEFYWFNESRVGYPDAEGRYTKWLFSVPSDVLQNLATMNQIADMLANEVESLHPYNAYWRLYEAVAEMASYGYADGVDDQTIDGIMLHHTGVCRGYAATFKYLCDRAGLYCILISGEGCDREGNIEGRHAWNLIEIGGSYYWVDVTWGDVHSERNNCYWYEVPNYYNYFCVTDDIFLKTHIISYTLGFDKPGHFTVTYPNCADGSYTLYQMTNARFSSYEESLSFIRNSLTQRHATIWMQYTSNVEVKRAFENLIYGGVITDLLKESGISVRDCHGFWDYEHQTIVIEIR